MNKWVAVLVTTTICMGATNANITTGSYFGMSAGYGAGSARLSTTKANAAGVFAGGAAGARDVGTTAVNIGAHLGYGWVANCFYFGGEFAYTYDNPKISDNIDFFGTSGQMMLKRTGYVQAAFRGGYMFVSNSHFYIRLGGNFSKWSITDSLNGQFNTARSGKSSKTRLSFSPGFGLEAAVHPNVYVRVEYVYEFGPSIRATNNSVSNAYTNAGVLRTQSGKMGLSYKF